MQEVMTALRQVSSEAEMRVIVIEAAGVAFSAGHDLGEMLGRDGAFYQHLFDLCSQMMEMLLTGDMIDAQTALEWGLVNRVVPALELDEALDQLVQAIVRSSPLTVGIGKGAFYAQIDLDEHRAYELTKSVMSLNSLAEDAQEGICAFMEKRPATWRGR